MGWQVGYDSNWKRDIGYGVPAICDRPGCGADIDRGAVRSAWPAAAFVGSVEMVMRLVRDTRAVTGNDTGDDTGDDTDREDKRRDDDTPPPPPRATAPRRPKPPDKVAAALACHPDWTAKQIADSAGVSSRTVLRHPAWKAARKTAAPTGGNDR